MDEMRRWAVQAASGIRFRPDREEVERELLEHMEDKQELLMRARGLDEEEAGREAVRQMGDAGQVKEELARIHKPWLGWLWQASRVLLVLLVIIPLFQWGPRMARSVQNRWELWSWEWENDPLAPYSGGNPHFSDQAQLWARTLEEAVWTDDYLFRVEETALWSGFYREGEIRMLYARLAVYGMPWQPFSPQTAKHIRATDSTGRTYLSTYETHTLGMLRSEEQGAVLTSHDAGQYEGNTFLLSVGVPAEAEWLRLEFNRGGGAWSLTIPLTEGEP